MMNVLFLFCALLTIAISKSDDSKQSADCSVDSTNNLLSGSSLCGELIVESDVDYTTISENQYASTSFPENISPSMIFIADRECNNDIKTILKYATECGYSVVMRSGGHQFSALSSCTDQCIQIDLSNYNETEIMKDNRFKQYKNVIKSGVGTELESLYSFLHLNGLFVPGGATTTIGIGGHFQTGGIGYLLRSHGAFTDSVIAFDIILSDGTSKLVTKENNYKDLFYAVRGGGPGSFGVVTNLYLNAFSNDDYPNNAMGVQAIWPYSDDDARALSKQWLIFQSDSNYTDYDDFFPLFAIAPDLTNGGHIILIAFIWIEDVNGRSYIDIGKGYFMQQFLDSAVNAPVLFLEIPGTVSSLMIGFLNDSPEISPIPYVLKANGVTETEKWNEEFMDILIDNVTSIISYSSINNNVFVNLLFETYGGNFLKNDPNKQLSALPFRDLSMLLAVQLFYTDVGGKQYAEDYLDSTFNEYLESLYITDIRTWGYTFGDLNMEKEKENLNYYIDENVFDSITKIKKKVDECNIFRNKFTVPLPDIDTNDIQDLDIIDLSAKDMLLIQQWTNRFYYELDRYTSTSINNGDCSDLIAFLDDNTTPDVVATAIGDIAGDWNGRKQFKQLFCGLFGPFINEDHFQSTKTFLSYQKQKDNKCKFNEKEIVKLATKTFIYSILTFEGNIRATYMNRNEFTFIRYKNTKKWLLQKWIVDVERVNVNNLG